MRGRKPKPTRIHKQNGNPSKLDLKSREANEPKPPEIEKNKGTPRPPKYFCKRAKKEWFRVIPILRSMGIFSLADTTAVEGYCVAYADFVKYSEALRNIGEDKLPIYETPNGATQQLPIVSMKRQAQLLVLKYCEQFGLTPSARGRMGAVPEGDDGDDEERQMNDVIAGRKIQAGKLKAIKDDK